MQLTKTPISHPQLEGFSIGDTFESQDGATKLTIVDFDPGSPPIGRMIMLPPSVSIRIETPNPEHSQGNLQAIAAINEVANRTRSAIGFEEKIAVQPPSATCGEDRNMDIEEFLVFVKNFSRPEEIA